MSIEVQKNVGFNEKQLQAIELLAKAEYEGLTQQGIAMEVGVTDRTIRRWLADKDFKDAVGRKSLELITELSPMVYKATADFLQSKDDRVRSKGVDTYLKATEKMEQLKKQDEIKEEAIDMDAILESIGAFTFRTAKNPERYLKERIHSNKERLEWAVSGLSCYKHMMEQLKAGESIDYIARMEEGSFEPDIKDVVGLLNEVIGNKEIVVLSKDEYERLVPEV